MYIYKFVSYNCFTDLYDTLYFFNLFSKAVAAILILLLQSIYVVIFPFYVKGFQEHFMCILYLCSIEFYIFVADK